MSEHHASIGWKRTSADYSYDTYNRAHEMRFKQGQIVLAASSAPEFKGDADRVDPEEAYVASLSSCHMLTFLAICARKRLSVDTYEDDAIGYLEKGPQGKLWMARATLSPRVKFSSGTNVAAATLDQLHHLSHAECFIANSVNTQITVNPRD
ncbi:MAG TPA: OsmC family protein [Rhizomicrobium sp.]|jgi:organic hydroperoxide reductase OsmC/OhrA